MKKYLISLLYFIIPFIVLLFISTLFYYFDIISNNGIKYLKLFITLISIFIGGFKIGKQSDKKGYQKGLILSSIIVFIFFIISLITKSFKINNLIYYIIILIIGSLGSMIGILKKN